jgi:hypothetical protein
VWIVGPLLAGNTLLLAVGQTTSVRVARPLPIVVLAVPALLGAAAMPVPERRLPRSALVSSPG